MRAFLAESSKIKLVNTLVVLILSIHGVSKQSFEFEKLSWFESFIVEVFTPLQQGTTTVKEKIDFAFKHYFFLIETSKRNEELKTRILELENAIFQYEEVQKENERLKELLQFGEEIPRQKVLSQVVGWDSSNEFKVLRINKGKNDGIELKSPVITINGLVGYVYRLSANYADILTILDQNNRVDAIVSRTRSHGIVEGTSNYKARLKYVVKTEPVQVGDTLITAGLGNIYPKGIKLGKITKIEKESFGLTQSIEITPSVDFHRLEEVVVLMAHENEASDKVVKDE
ncbi:MAG: rod shape-determining protein MreC [Bacteriovoracaceae bacterium]|nr:rod shape-determining protein MreC [Bacteriovoracaceae bacterium]